MQLSKQVFEKLFWSQIPFYAGVVTSVEDVCSVVRTNKEEIVRGFINDNNDEPTGEVNTGMFIVKNDGTGSVGFICNGKNILTIEKGV